MKRTAYDCDICLREDVKEGSCCSFILDTDRRMDAAGSMETIVDNIDICKDCSINVLETIARILNGKHDHELNSKIMISLRNLHLDGGE